MLDFWWHLQQAADILLPLKFPKTVVVLNPYVSVLHKGLLLFTFITLVANFWYQDLAFAQDEVGKYIKGSIWIDGTSFEPMQLRALMDSEKVASVCKSPSQFDHWEDPSGYFSYQNYTCYPVCAPGAGSFCLTQRELYFQEKEDQIFLVTSGQRFLEYHGGEGSQRVKAFLAPSVERMSIGFTYSLKVPTRRWYDLVRDDLGAVDDFERADASKDVVTAILNENKEVATVLEPQDMKRLTVDELLRLSGNHGGLYSPLSKRSTPNFLPGAKLEYPVGMIRGYNLDLHLRCYNYMKKDVSAYLKQKKDYEFFCYAFIGDAERRTDHVKETVYDDHVETTQFQGIRVTMRTGGYFRRLDINNLMLNLAAFLVYVQVPAVVVLFFIISCLGKLSQVYYHEIYEEFHLGERMASVTAKLVSESMSFAMLHTGDSLGLSRKRTQEQLRYMFQASQARKTKDGKMHKGTNKFIDAFGRLLADDVNDRLNARETAMLADFAFDVMQDRIHVRSGAPCKFTPAEKEEECHVGLGHYLNATAARTEAVGFTTVIELLSQKRKRSCLERFFMPKYLKEYLASWDAQNRDVDQNEDEDEIEPKRASEFIAEQMSGVLLPNLTKDIKDIDTLGSWTNNPETVGKVQADQDKPDWVPETEDVNAIAELRSKGKGEDNDRQFAADSSDKVTVAENLSAQSGAKAPRDPHYVML